MNITSIAAWQIFDSRGVPTVEAEVTLANGTRGRGIAPSGASTGQFEALELRDRDPRRFRGKSVFQAIEHIEREIAFALSDVDVTQRFAQCNGTGRIGGQSGVAQFMQEAEDALEESVLWRGHAVPFSASWARPRNRGPGASRRAAARSPWPAADPDRPCT